MKRHARPEHPAIILFALAMGGFAIGTTEFAAMSLVPYFAPALMIDTPTAGHVISAYALGVVIGAPLIAAFGARMSRQKLLIRLMLAFAVANVLSGLAPNYETMLLFRFLSGLPHGAYFGVAALVASSLVPPEKRAQAVAKAMLGLTVATIIGVPMANGIGLFIGWRWGFGLVALVALLTAVLVRKYVPCDGGDRYASPMRELGALKNRQVWLTLSIGAIGFGGLFAVYTYIANTLIEVTEVSPTVVPFVLAIIGIGLTVGTLLGAWMADRALMPTAGGLLLFVALMLAIYPYTITSLWALVPCVFFIGWIGGLGVALQTRLMDVAGDAQTLAAAMHHSAFNFANALGPLLGGMALAGGYGYESVGWVGCGLALGGFVIWRIAVWDDRLRRNRFAAQAG
jgi:DHA1 family inner membrane transport protein